ncbi:uncharacterized protein [Aegilops tauschii subsp. strangulata]|uniref:uncharacterized protein n=1 Tax=Aegilops tauschii subsp. strangulata TaxID=200361 RepID=UPI00098ACA7F|nr:uncharacterized protein LOC109787041 [Aegilops tauschii subsp. strangulata]
MRDVWNLPSESKFWYTGDDWLQNLLDMESEEGRTKILLILWRSWHLREDCLRNNGRESIGSSVQFLQNYEEELRGAAGSEEGPGSKVKEYGRETREQNTEIDANQWKPPGQGTVKINTDAAFLAGTGESAAGVVGRDSQGLVLMSVYKKLPRCQSAEEAEAHAALVGLQAMAGVYKGQIILEMDNQNIANELISQEQTRSPNYALIMDIRNAMAGFEACNVSCVKR